MEYGICRENTSKKHAYGTSDPYQTSPAYWTSSTDILYGLVAQWIAHLTSDQKVAGSSPVWVDYSLLLRQCYSKIS